LQSCDFLATAEFIESDRWTQYAELGGIGDDLGAVAGLTSDRLFTGQNNEYLKLLKSLAEEVDAAVRN
jgi:hypothetical protein